MLPFTPEAFFEVFARYNSAIWPAQIGAAGLGFVASLLVLRSGPVASRAISLILAGFWLLMGIGYHLVFFSRVNTLAYAFGLLFVAQAALLFVDGVVRNQIGFEPERGWRGWLAWVVIAYGLGGVAPWGVTQSSTKSLSLTGPTKVTIRLLSRPRE